MKSAHPSCKPEMPRKRAVGKQLCYVNQSRHSHKAEMRKIEWKTVDEQKSIIRIDTLTYRSSRTAGHSTAKDLPDGSLQGRPVIEAIFERRRDSPKVYDGGCIYREWEQERPSQHPHEG
jgi:hypothetical protein